MTGIVIDYGQFQQCNLRGGFLQMDNIMMMEKPGLMDVDSVTVMVEQRCVTLSLVQCQPARILSSMYHMTAVHIVQVMHI